jgi:hypothetical protein
MISHKKAQKRISHKKAQKAQKLFLIVSRPLVISDPHST